MQATFVAFARRAGNKRIIFFQLAKLNLGGKMKSRVIIIAMILMFVISSFYGCGKQLTYGDVVRDPAMTGGDLSFVYDRQSHTATFGGEGEVVSYYVGDEDLGIKSGNRIGVKIYAPDEITDYSKAKLEFEGMQYTSGSFMSKVYDKVQNYFILKPIVSENINTLEVKVTWTQDSATQSYIIKIADGTKFAKP